MNSSSVAAPKPRFADLSTESEILTYFVNLFHEVGLPTDAPQLSIVAGVGLPAYRVPVVVFPRCRGGWDVAMGELLEYLKRFDAEPARFFEAFKDNEEALRAYREYCTLGIAHELFHHVQHSRRYFSRLSAFTQESGAIDLEQAVLFRLVATGQVQSEALVRYRTFARAILRALPATTLPKEAFKSSGQRLLERAARTYRVSVASRQQYLAVLTRYRLERLRRPISFERIATLHRRNASHQKATR